MGVVVLALPADRKRGHKVEWVWVCETKLSSSPAEIERENTFSFTLFVFFCFITFAFPFTLLLHLVPFPLIYNTNIYIYILPSLPDMDFCRNVSVSGEHQQEQVLSPPCSKLSSGLDDLFSSQNMEADVSLEWLSIFVEDCLSSKGNCLPPPTSTNVETTTPPKPSTTLKLQKPQNVPSSLQKLAVPGKARSKRKRAILKNNNPLTSWSNSLILQNQTLQIPSSDPPLLQQTYWMADSELIVPKKVEISGMRSDIEHEEEEETEEEEEEEEDKKMVMMNKESSEDSNGLQPMPRRCTHCLAQRTPQWRAGPLGPKTLCNACGVRYKSGRLLPEYRPAKSPTFVSFLHSNSHKKVLEMRMSLPSSIPSGQ